MPGHAFRAAVEAGDLDAATGLLADDAVFNSPAVFKPYKGREAVATILRAAYATFEDFRYTDELTGDGVHGLVFTARVGDRIVQGIDLIRGDADGRIEDFTVMLRPASGLMAVAERMGAALAAAGVSAPPAAGR
jgi:ketosteroid isomerase-like protein